MIDIPIFDKSLAFSHLAVEDYSKKANFDFLYCTMFYLLKDQ